MKRILPGFVALKNFFVARRSKHIALLYDAFLYVTPNTKLFDRALNRFRELCKDHRQSLDVFLQSDPQLKSEVEYDLAKLEVRPLVS